MNVKSTNFKRISLHISYWIVFSLIYPFFMTMFMRRSFDYEMFEFQIVALLISYTYLIPTTYFITYYLIPKLFEKRRIALSILLSICIIIGMAFLDEVLCIYVYYPIVAPDHLESFIKNTAFNPTHLFIVGILLFTQIILFISIKFLKEYFTSYFEKQKLKQQIYDTELKMLKSQLHPHFLFNTLNNIYSLSIDCNNPLVSQSIERISDILRYSLYECNDEIVNLSKEIQIIKDYIELERIRYSNISIDTSFPKDVTNVYLIPLLLFTFVENAFKHGTSNAIKDKWIKLNLSISDEKLLFVISNSKNPKNQSGFNKYNEGVGLKNAIKRLDLFYGSENYTLVQNNKNNSFEINLTINLNHKN